MKVIIMSDIEGVSGLGTDDIQFGTGGYYRACELLMGDVNAAVQGAVRAGADEIIVFDGHGGAHNFIYGTLNPKAKYLNIRALYDPQTFMNASAYIQIGAHAMAGTQNAFLDHTQSSKSWFDYRVNGESLGEMAQGALVAGAYGVPAAAVSGDLAACQEAERLFDGVVCAQVKKASCRSSAECIPVSMAHGLITDAVYLGIRRAADMKPFVRKMPLEIVVEYTRSDYCDEAEKRSRFTRTGARTMRRILNEINNYGDLLP